MIHIDDFAKCEIKIGTIISAEIVEGADKLLCFQVDLGETTTSESGETTPTTRQILSGIREYFPHKEDLIGRQVPVVTNLAPRTIRGLESHGMILYAVGDAENFTTLSPAKKVLNGTLVR